MKRAMTCSGPRSPRLARVNSEVGSGSREPCLNASRSGAQLKAQWRRPRPQLEAQDPVEEEAQPQLEAQGPVEEEAQPMVEPQGE